MMNETTVEDGTLTYLPVANIRHRDGFNPRRYFDPEKMRELVDSVRASGVVQPIVVRAADESNHHEIIAGERRWRAAQTVGLTEIPAVIRDVSEVEAISISMVENTHRDDLGPSEEARKARDFLTVCNGDRDEVCRRLGWTMRTLESRLSLLHCTESVLNALDERQISLGHGELMATLPAQTQDGTLPKIIDQKITVAALRERIQGISRLLEKAKFDVTECQGCGHNSTIQASLFDIHIGTGKCSNPKCYAEKTAIAMQSIKARLVETYAAVWLDTERAPNTYAVLEKGGEKGIGSAQFENGCRQCANFGVVITTSAGREGTITEDVCFDLPCRKQKIKAFATLTQEAPATQGVGKPALVTQVGASLPKASTPQSSASPGSTPKKVEQAIDERLRGMAATVAMTDPRVARAVRLYALWKDADYVPWASIGCSEIPAIESHSRSRALALFINMDSTLCEQLERALVGHILAVLKAFDNTEMSSAAAYILQTTKTDLSKWFVVDAPLLQAYHKAGMVALLKESGFDKWYDAKHGVAKFAKLCNAAMKVIVDAAMKDGQFDWSNFVPAAVTARFQNLAKK